MPIIYIYLLLFLIGFIVKITEIKSTSMKNIVNPKLEEKLKALRLSADDLPIPIIVHQLPDFKVIYMNEVGLEILGVNLAELQTIDPKEYVARYFNKDDDAEATPKIHRRVMDDSSKPSSYFQQVKSKDGEWNLYASNTKVFLKDEAGNTSHVITTASPLAPDHHITIKINRLMDDIRFLRKNVLVFGKLSAREIEILKLMALGLSSLEIADRLFIAMATVDTHRKNIRQKLSLKNNYDAVKFAHAFNLV